MTPHRDNVSVDNDKTFNLMAFMLLKFIRILQVLHNHATDARNTFLELTCL